MTSGLPKGPLSHISVPNQCWTLGKCSINPWINERIHRLLGNDLTNHWLPFPILASCPFLYSNTFVDTDIWPPKSPGSLYAVGPPASHLSHRRTQIQPAGSQLWWDRNCVLWGPPGSPLRERSQPLGPAEVGAGGAVSHLPGRKQSLSPPRGVLALGSCSPATLFPLKRKQMVWLIGVS